MQDDSKNVKGWLKVIECLGWVMETNARQVSLDHTTYPFRPFGPKPIQWCQCWRFRHSSRV